MRGLLAAVAVVLVEFAVFAMLPTGPVPAGVLALLAAAVVVALWQRYRRAEREQEAAVNQERLRLARDMHDRIGRRLGLAAVQAAALEVRETDPERRAEARRVGDSLRGAVEDLHGLVAVLRGAEEAADAEYADFDHAAAASLAARFIEAGARVELRQRGEPGPFTAAGSRAAYAVLEEGLANAAKHAPGTLAVATVAWEEDALLVTVENPLPGAASAPASDIASGSGSYVAAGAGSGADAAAGVSGSVDGAAVGAVPVADPPLPPLAGGHGLTGLRERVDAAGGLLDHRAEDGRFRLSAMLPRVREPKVARRVKAAAFATLVLLLVLVPLTSVAGVQG
ncbi:histidine kinase [Glycomyces sp. NPDC047010]|uniref:sensor histidine kinase n=1 Tax=Glycomyces sp. NPDC047010 TaxID=3155023 RepID=UPI003409D22F